MLKPVAEGQSVALSGVMLYVVGGCSRSGKSILAERMRARHGVPWFSLDALKMGLYLGAPSLRVLPDADDLATADLMWPIVEPILDHAAFDARDYLVEGVTFGPRRWRVSSVMPRHR